MLEAANQTAASFAQPELWELVDKLPKSSQPQFVRGDCNWGTERAMEGCEQRQLPYLFKLKQSANVKKLIQKLDRPRRVGRGRTTMARAGHRTEAERLDDAGRVIVLRRPLPEKAKAKQAQEKGSKQLSLGLPEAMYEGIVYEYAVWVTSLPDEVRTVALHWSPVFRLELDPPSLPRAGRCRKSL